MARFHSARFHSLRFSPARLASVMLLAALVCTHLPGASHAKERLPQQSHPLAFIAEASPALAPFQHVRFCLRYPDDCKSEPVDSERVAFNPETSSLLDRVNRGVNAAISPSAKDYGADVQNGWTISPAAGDCNDYAVTKRHELLQGGLPAGALRLSVVKTSAGIGHLVLVVATTKGDLVLDNLIGTIRPWQQTEYRWLKIQSSADARFWYEVKATGMAISEADRRIRLADRR